jgi:acetyltransferase
MIFARGSKVDQLFYPKSVVVVGVSERPDNLARNIVENLFEFQFGGDLFVGKRGGILFGRRICTSWKTFMKDRCCRYPHPCPNGARHPESSRRKEVTEPSSKPGGFEEYSEEGQLENEILQIARKWGSGS